jgi:excisionase family DNA binding protein
LKKLIRLASAEELPALAATLSSLNGMVAVRMLETSPSSAASESEDKNLSAEEAAERLGVSKYFLYRNATRLPFTRRIGRRLLFSSRGLRRWNERRG